MKDLAGKVAVVTGAAHGIGRATALALADRGMAVAIADLVPDEVDDAVAAVQARGVEAIGVPTDVRDAAALEHLAVTVEAALGPVRLLHNNAGVGLIEPIETTTLEDFRWVMDVNYFGVVHGLLAFVPRMRARGGEHHIVNTGSSAGLHVSDKLGGYSASKFAVTALSEGLRQELAPSGIRVSLLCPGTVGTRIMGRSRRLRSLQSRPLAPPERSREQGTWTDDRIVSAEEVAEILVDGILHDRFWIHTERAGTIRYARRFDEILDAAADVPEL